MPRKQVTPELNEITGRIVDGAVRVHRALGPGLLESVYVRCLTEVLERAGLHVRREVWVPVSFEGVIFAQGLRLDMLVEEQVVVEVKSVERVLHVHSAQILTQMRLAEKPLGLLLNFNVPRMRMGIQRFVMSAHLRE